MSCSQVSKSLISIGPFSCGFVSSAFVPGFMVPAGLVQRLMVMSGSDVSTYARGCSESATFRLTEVVTTAVRAGQRQTGMDQVGDFAP